MLLDNSLERLILEFEVSASGRFGCGLRPNVMRLPAESAGIPSIVDLTVTSPPYDKLRKYNGESVWNMELFSKLVPE